MGINLSQISRPLLFSLLCNIFPVSYLFLCCCSICTLFISVFLPDSVVKTLKCIIIKRERGIIESTTDIRSGLLAG